MSEGTPPPINTTADGRSEGPGSFKGKRITLEEARASALRTLAEAEARRAAHREQEAKAMECSECASLRTDLAAATAQPPLDALFRGPLPCGHSMTDIGCNGCHVAELVAVGKRAAEMEGVLRRLQTAASIYRKYADDEYSEVADLRDSKNALDFAITDAREALGRGM